jgi:hypothetical protein
MIPFTQARWLLALPLTAVSSLGVARATKVANRPVCQMASEWVAARQGNLPSTFAAIRQYPTLYQRTIYGNLVPAERTRIWQEKLTPLMAPTSDLTEPQRAVVATIVNRLDGYTRDPRGILDAIRTQQDGLAARIQNAFDDAAAHRLFGALDVSADTSMAASVRAGLIKQPGLMASVDAFVDGIARILGHEPAKAVISFCSCHADDLDNTGCPVATVCDFPRGTDQCDTQTPIPDSCGENGDQLCDGLCY